MEKPKFVILAGSDGAGKTTLYRKFIGNFQKFEYLSSDVMLQNFNGNWRKSNDQIKAMLQVNDRSRELIQKNQNIVYEVNFGGTQKNLVKLVDLAHTLNYEVILIEVEIRDAELAVERILQRFKQGGYGASPELIKRRFQDVKRNFNTFKSLVDRVIKFNNTIVLKRCD